MSWRWQRHANILRWSKWNSGACFLVINFRSHHLEALVCSFCFLLALGFFVAWLYSCWVCQLDHITGSAPGLCEGVGSNPVFFLRASSVAALQGLEICFWLVVSCCFNTSPKVRSTCRGPCGRARSMIAQENRPCLFTRHRGRCTDRTLRTSWERACRPKRLGITIWGETRLLPAR